MQKRVAGTPSMRVEAVLTGPRYIFILAQYYIYSSPILDICSGAY